MVPECRFPSSGKASPLPLPGFETLNLAQGVDLGSDPLLLFSKGVVNCWLFSEQRPPRCPSCMPSGMWVATGCRAGSWAPCSTTPTRTGPSLCYCWTPCLGTCGCTFTRSPSPPRARRTSQVSAEAPASPSPPPPPPLPLRPSTPQFSG